MGPAVRLPCAASWSRIAGNRYVEYINGLIPEAPAGLRDYFFAGGVADEFVGAAAEVGGRAGAVQLIEPMPLAPYCT